MHGWRPPPFFSTKKKPKEAGDVDVQMYPCWRAWIYTTIAYCSHHRLVIDPWGTPVSHWGRRLWSRWSRRIAKVMRELRASGSSRYAISVNTSGWRRKRNFQGCIVPSTALHSCAELKSKPHNQSNTLVYWQELLTNRFCSDDQTHLGTPPWIAHTRSCTRPFVPTPRLPTSALCWWARSWSVQ